QPGGEADPAAPPVAKQVRVAVRSRSGRQCCAAVARAQMPHGTAATLLLEDLPLGPAAARITAYEGDFAPAPEGIVATCRLGGGMAAQPCDPNRRAHPVYDSPEQDVIVLRPDTAAPAQEVRALA